MNLHAIIIAIKERHRNGFMRKNILSKIAMQLTIWSIEDCNQKQIPRLIIRIRTIFRMFSSKISNPYCITGI